jgi:hypothetical protein
VLAGIFASSLVKTAITTLLLAYYILLLWSSLALPVGKQSEAKFVNVYGAQDSIPWNRFQGQAFAITIFFVPARQAT